MKKNITLCLLGSFLFASVFLSPAAAQWNLTGNSNATAASKLGTTNAIPLNLTTNNLTRIFIATNGKVGIGTTTPGSGSTIDTRLHVFGSGTGTSGRTQAIIENNAATAGANLIVKNNLGNTLSISSFGSTYGSGLSDNQSLTATNELVLGTNWSVASGGASAISFRPGGFGAAQERMRIAASGFVGIGTIDPQYRLHVEGVNNQAIFVNTSALSATAGSGVTGAVKQLPTAAGQRLGFFLVGSRGGAENQLNSGGLAGFAEGAWSGSSRPTYLTLETTASGSTARLERVRITGNGFVGIGTANPSNELHVIGRGRFSNGVSVESGGIFTTDFNGNGIEGYGNTSFGIGVRGEGHWGVYGVASGGSGSYGGYFVGDVFTTGVYAPSDRNFKQNITEIGSAMDLINKLQPKTYEYRHDGNFKLLRLPEGKHFGLIAQELEQVLPTLVKDTKFDTQMGISKNHQEGQTNNSAQQAIPEKVESIVFKAVNYNELIPIMIRGMQDMDKRVQATETENANLRQEIAELRQMVLDLKRNGVANGNMSAYIAQCTPNPAKSSTRISYSLPEGSNSALLQITDNLGRTVRMIQLTNSGATNVDVSSLSAGIYNYSLVVDNKTIQTKKMTVVK